MGSAFVLALSAQNNLSVEPTPQISKFNTVQSEFIDADNNSFLPYKPYKTEAMAGNKNISRVAIGSSANPYSVISIKQNCLDYSPSLDMLLFTHRKSVNITSGNSGFIQASYSHNQGQTWNYQMVYESTADHGRYPSGVIYNPVGNTDTANAYVVVAGPAIRSTPSTWVSYFASETFAGTNNNVNIFTDTSTTTNLVMNDMNIAADGTVRIYGQRNIFDGTNYTSIKTVIYTGTFNSATNAWTWTEQEHVPPYRTNSQGLPMGYATPGMVWSKDGQTGYLVFIGTDIDAADPIALNPIVYKTTDAGTNWAKQPSFNFSTITAIDSLLIPIQGGSGIKRPFFEGISDLTIDANDNLHLFTYIKSHSSNSLDSAFYRWTYTNAQGYLYHAYTTATGWDAEVVDLVKAKDGKALLGDNLWFTARPQISKIPDETKLVFAWLDTDPILGTDNYSPDIKVQYYDITTGHRSETMNLTQNTNFDGSNYYLFLAPWSKYDAASQTITPHMTVSDIGTADSLPVAHFYFSGVNIFTNVNEVASVGNISISQNYPNPASDVTMIDINLNKSTNVSVELFNVLGQRVQTQSLHLTSGSHTLSLNVQSLKSGIYFYTVRAGNEVVTKKMIKN